MNTKVFSRQPYSKALLLYPMLEQPYSLHQTSSQELQMHRIQRWLKYLYPVIIAIVFIPSVFIYYNETAMIHSMWYLVVSSIGMLIGAILRKLIFRNK